MSLLDRYVDAVSAHLPRTERHDIAAELRDILRSQLEAEQAERGRPLTDEEIAGILKGYGAPDVVASRYAASGASDQHLIGPAAFRHYTFAVKLVLATIVPLMVLSVCYNAFGDDATVSSVALNVWTWCTILLLNLAVLTVVFARLDRLQVFHVRREWDPRGLVPRDPDVVSRPEAVGGLLMSSVMLLWWLGLLPWARQWYGANIVFGPFRVDWFRIDVPFHLAPVWDALAAPIIALLALDIVLQAFSVLRPRVTRWRAGVELVSDLAGLAILCRVLVADQVVVIGESSAPWARSLAPLATLAWFGLLVLAVFVVINIVENVRRVVRQSPGVVTA